MKPRKPKRKISQNFQVGDKVKTSIKGETIQGMVVKNTFFSDEETFYVTICENGTGRLVKTAQYNAFRI